ELAARLRAILRRAGQPGAGTSTDTIRAGKLVIHPGSRIAEWRGETLELTGTEFSLLEVLARSAGQLVSISPWLMRPGTPIPSSAVDIKRGGRDGKKFVRYLIFVHISHTE
ncbi:response regulator transcription factor, partial [Rhizobium ruizarguesonis]|nr:response regulator transcription factor [Rhizobium ruizarguesonis]